MIRKLLLISMILVLPTSAIAVPLSGQYSITSSAAMDGINWNFTYNITNINQGSYQYFSGLDGFFVMIPDSATIIDVTVPLPYFDYGYWSYETTDTPLAFLTDQVPALPDGYTWLKFWGNEPRSTYWFNSTATFSFTLGGVIPGENPGVLVSYIPIVGINPVPGWYSVFDSNMLSPVPSVPEPATMLLFGAGLAGLGLMRKRMKG